MDVFLCRYQIVVEIIHATTISSLPQLKKQKGTKILQFTETPKKCFYTKTENVGIQPL